MGAFEDYINGSWQGLKRGVTEAPRNLLDSWKPGLVEGIKSYDSAITGTDLPYYGDDEISAAREQFDKQPRSNTSRLVDLIGNITPGAAASKAAPVAVRAGETVLGAGPVATRAVKVLDKDPITGKGIFEVFDDAGASMGRRRAMSEEDAVAGHQRMQDAQASRAANPQPEPIEPHQDEVAAAAPKPQRNNWRIFRGEPQTDDGYLYHVSSYPNARNILQEGLQPGYGGSTFSGGAYEGYSKGKAFVTDPEGVDFWKNRVEAYLQHNNDKAPALATLRIPKNKVTDLQIDELGTRDAYANAYYSTKPILSVSNPLAGLNELYRNREEQ
jgi:hypothetical protein